VLQEAVDELFGGEGAELGLSGIGGAITESDLIVLQIDQAAVADGDAEDVRGQVLHCGAAIADWFAVDNPLLFPNVRGDGVSEGGLVEGVEELGSEDLGEGFHGQQEILLCRQPGLAIGSQPTGRDEIV
jgi:hypothetical protein